MSWRIPRGRSLAAAGGALLLALALTLSWWAMRRQGRWIPRPEPGRQVAAVQPTAEGPRGFVVWSSNRFGNHDILMMRLPGRAITRLTTDPHTETFPRISPDGNAIVYARSQRPWVSQRDEASWDTWLLDLQSGQTRLLAKNANAPTWSERGDTVYFQRDRVKLVAYDLARHRESVVLEAGGNLPVPAGTRLQTPGWSHARQEAAVTLRGRMRATALAAPGRPPRIVGGGCQLTWAPDSSFLVRVDHGGAGGNALFRVDPLTLESSLWFDAPQPYSHEYFPRLDRSGQWLVFGASTGGHEHDRADYEIFLWHVGEPPARTRRLTFHTGNDCWPDIFLE